MGLAALGILGLTACRRPPTATNEDGGLAGPFTCTGWTKVATTPFPNTYRGIWGSSPTDVYFVHRYISATPFKPPGNEVQRYDGTSVTSVPTGSVSSPGSPYIGTPVGIWGSGASDLYVTLTEGLLRFDGTTWSKVAGAPTFTIRNIWGTGPNDVYAVGDGRVARFDGTSWSTLLNMDTYRFNAVWGSGPKDIYVAAQTSTNSSNGAVYHFDGATWSAALSKPWSAFGGVWGTGPSNVLAAGYSGNGFIYRFDGQAWSKEALPWHEVTIGRLNVIWGHNSSRVFVGGISGLLGWDGQQWSPIDVPSSSYDDIEGLWGSGTTLFVAANEWNGDGAIWRATCEP